MLSWVESIRIELNCSTPSWYLRITCKLLELSVKHLPLKKKKNKFGDITACLTLRDSLLSLFSCLVQSKSLQPHGLQHARLPCSSLFPGVCSNSCPLSYTINGQRTNNNLVLCHLLLLLPSIFPSIMVFSNELAFCIRWPKYWSFSFTIIPSNKCSGLISFRIK